MDDARLRANVNCFRVSSMFYDFLMRSMHTGKLLSVVGIVLIAMATGMYFLSEHIGIVLKQHAILNDFCMTALILDVFGLMFLLIGSIFLALRIQPAISFSVAVGLVILFGVVLVLREHDVLRFNETSWTSSLFALSGILFPMSAFYFIGGCIREVRERMGKAKR